MQGSALNNAALLIGRLLLAAIFVTQGYSKILGYAGAQAYMEKFGVPGLLLPLVIALEVLGGLLIIVGWQTRLAAIALGGFCILAALLFHMNFDDRNQVIQFYKNLAVAGGFLALYASGPGAWSIDGRKSL